MPSGSDAVERPESSDWSADLIETADGAEFTLRVLPRASRVQLQRHTDRSLKLAITAPPVDGAANAAVVKALGNLLRVPKSSITIIKGHQGRIKRIAVAGMSADELKSRLDEVLNS